MNNILNYTEASAPREKNINKIILKNKVAIFDK